MDKKLVYNVYHEDINRRNIEVVNILGYGCVTNKLQQLRYLYRKAMKIFNTNGVYIKEDHFDNSKVVIKSLDEFDTKFKYDIFAKELKNTLMYYFWSKCECEIVLTSWPPHIDYEDYKKLIEHTEEDIEKYGREPYVVDAPVNVFKKIDMFEQVMNNWDVFIDYVWANFMTAKLVN